MEKIFVAIASYRYTECQWTVKDMFESAAFPDRVFVGICWQTDQAQDENCFVEPYPRPDQVRTLNVALEDARGACWAKSKALSLAEGEDYYLLIDSHMRFAKSWDTELIEMLGGIGNKRAFISTYPAGYEPPDSRGEGTPRLRPTIFFDRVLSQDSVGLDMPKPLPSYLVAGGFIFGLAEMFEEIKYDPNIYFIGEEITHAARYYTHGWDGYAPNKCLIYHYYTRKGSVRHWEDQKDHWPKLNLLSYKRIRHLLDVERTSDPEALVDIEKYGMGSVRSLDDFQAIIGVNIMAQLIDKNRHDSVEAVEASLIKPQPPLYSYEMARLGLYACRHGYMLLPKHDQYISKSLIKYGEWVEGLNDVFRAIFSPGGLAIEVGAGFGAHTLPLARLVGFEGKLIAIEQSRRIIDILYGNVALNSLENVQLVHARVGAVSGMIEVSEPVFDYEANFGMVSTLEASAGKPDNVNVITLDNQSWGRIDFIFIDTPGEVSEVLAGSRRLIASHRPAMVVNSDNLNDSTAVNNTMIEFGYKTMAFSCPFFSKKNYFKVDEDVFPGLISNYIVAVPNDMDFPLSLAA